MRIAFFCHSLLSDWNNGNAHFQRGLLSELVSQGHAVEVFERVDAWSVINLVADHGALPLAEVRRVYPWLKPVRYEYDSFEPDAALDGVDLVVVHEWNEPELVKRIGDVCKRSSLKSLFHDTHHRSVTAPWTMEKYDLSGYDGVLAFGAAVRDIYLQKHWAARAWTFHEAADTRLFRPLGSEKRADLVWIGNFGDDERTEELEHFLLEPASGADLAGEIYGVRYPETVRERLLRQGFHYRGWLPNYRAPELYSQFRMTVHVPRRPYAQALPGIPTIRPFEALACGIPLICAPWLDAERLFRPGVDYLVARDGVEMRRHLRALRADEALGKELATNGLATIRERHTCAHRAAQLLEICAEIGIPAAKKWGALERKGNQR